ELDVGQRYDDISQVVTGPAVNVDRMRWINVILGAGNHHPAQDREPGCSRYDERQRRAKSAESMKTSHEPRSPWFLRWEPHVPSPHMNGVDSTASILAALPAGS